MLGLPIETVQGDPDGPTALRVVGMMLRRGYILLPSGVRGHVLGFAPPFIITRAQLKNAMDVLEDVLREVFTSS